MEGTEPRRIHISKRTVELSTRRLWAFDSPGFFFPFPFPFLHLVLQFRNRQADIGRTGPIAPHARNQATARNVHTRYKLSGNKKKRPSNSILS